MVKAKIIMLGLNLKKVETKLKYSGIECTEIISRCNPLSMIGERDESLLEMSKQTNNMHTHLDIKKNLSQMLSKDPKNFVQNYNYMPYAKNVEYCNVADYIVINNIGLLCEIYSNGKYIYSVEEKNDFTDHIKSDKSYKKVPFPFDARFKWKEHYDRFVDAVLSNYDPRHIVLLKTYCSPFYMNGADICEFAWDNSEICDLLREADAHFAARTNCITVDEAYNFIPDKSALGSDFPAVEYSDACVEKISHILEDIILNRNIIQYKPYTSCVGDIINLYKKYNTAQDKTGVLKEIERVLESGTSLSVNSAKALRQRNIEFLSEYRYVSDRLKKFSAAEKVYVGLGGNIYIVLNPKADIPILKTEHIVPKEIDYNAVIEDGYVCPVEQADLLCRSLKFYIEKARRGDGNVPVKIIFDSYEDFNESLNYVDYPDLMENEHFLLGLKDDNFDIEDYTAGCDLGFFFDKNVKICMLDNGFTNQIIYYIFSKRLEDYTGSIIYYDDLIYCFDYIMNGLEIDKIAKEDIGKRLFSNIFTRKLLSNFKIGDVVADKLAENGLKEMLVIANNNEELGNTVTKCNKLCLCSIEHDFMDKIFNCGFYPLYFRYFIRPEWLMSLRPFELSQYIEFPKMSGKNQELEKTILNCDAVAVHIRRGDFVGLGWATDTKFYFEAISKLLKIPDYPNKKYFVFSDDILWVKEHASELGFGLVGDDDVIYIDHNKDDNSYLDMYLISLAKIVISSGSGFARTAALLGTRCEDFIFGIEKSVKMYEMVGRKNKHKITIDNKVVLDYSTVVSEREATRKNNSM